MILKQEKQQKVKQEELEKGGVELILQRIKKKNLKQKQKFELKNLSLQIMSRSYKIVVEVYIPDSSIGQFDPYSPPGQFDPYSPPGQFDPYSPPGQFDPYSPPGQFDP